MKFFLDTANLDEIKQGVAWGIVDGVTTNPSLVAKEGVSFHNRIKEICALVNGSVSAEVTAIDFEGMIREGHVLANLHPNVTVKVPLIPDGIRACKALSAEGIKVNVTLCFSPAQALLAAKAGATYISPFVGRLDDVASDGMKLVEDIVNQPGVAPDKRFVYYILAHTGICVVPLSSFNTSLLGFRVTLLERDETECRRIYRTLTENIAAYIAS